VSEVLPVVGFYLQPSVGGRALGFRFWRELAELPGVVAIKIAPFNRYATIDVVRAVAEAGREDIALYTGNDDAIVTDLLTPFPCQAGGRTVERRMVGGLLGQWAVWTRRAVELLTRVKRTAAAARLERDWLRLAAALTDANGAIFDARHGFAGCIPGIHEVLRRQGLLRGVWCLDPRERLSPGQSEEIDRVLRTYPELADDEFVAEHLDRWLA
jgi:dihydrodipicolinate synthase/N-acetylneuraminate lyase